MRRRRVPSFAAAEYTQLRREGLSQVDAAALICFRHGLGPVGEPDNPGTVEARQRAAHGGGATPWKLHELAYLLAVRAWAAMAPDTEPVLLPPKRKLRGRCDTCPPGLPAHGRH